MRNRDAFGVIHATGRVPYADGAEEVVLQDLLDTVDRSDGSDELAAKIRDWPTRYHFSPLRSNLLRPLLLRPGMRVLEVGCGTGPITRWLGERGANVLAIEGSVHRARAAAVRCTGLSNVEVVAGTLDDVPTEAKFDVVVVVGVLEYAPVFISSDDGPRTFLETVVRHLADDGAMVLAIENQLGLKYLLGYGEDHHALPWVGVEGYARTTGPRTWSRQGLGNLLRDVGLGGQHWLFPFPDYKLPSIVIDERLYQRPGGPALVNQFVRVPVTADASAPQLLCDARLAHRQILAAGFGHEVSNSFLAVASRTQADAEAFVGPELAWLFSNGRRRQWRRQRVVVAGPDCLKLVDRGNAPEARALGWLKQTRGSGEDRPLVAGEPLDVLLLEAVRRNDIATVTKFLVMWRSKLETLCEPASSQSHGHPFAPADGAMALPEDLLDVGPSNAIFGDGILTFIDREWSAPSPVSIDLVQIRALWWFAREVIESGDSHPWGSFATVDEVCRALCLLAGLRYDCETFVAWQQAEADLQHLVNGGDVAVHASHVSQAGARRTVDITPRVLPFTALRASVDMVRHESEELRAKVTELESALSEVESASKVEADELRTIANDFSGRLTDAKRALAESHDKAARLGERLARSEDLRTEMGHEINRLKREIEAWSDRMTRIEQRLPVRVYRAMERLSRHKEAQ